MRFLFIALISIYQKTFSPDHSWLRGRWPHGFCRFYPSCSEYAKQSIRMHGSVRGTWLAAKRVGKCNPWSVAAFDPVPKH